MLRWLVNLLKMPEAPNIENLDEVHSTLFHREIIKKKPFLKKLYLEYYNIFKENVQDVPKGFKIELGSGGGFLKEIITDVITSDVLDVSGVDKVFSAEKIPFPDESVSAFILLGTLHHIKHPDMFFSEIKRCLKLDGKVVMIEPTNSLFSRFFYKYFHHEVFDEKSNKWEIDGGGRLTDANLALPWIIFVRDREKFQKKYPALEILQVNKHTPFRWWLSGGLTTRQLVPSTSFEFFRKLEIFLTPCSNHLGSFMTIVLKKS